MSCIICYKTLDISCSVITPCNHLFCNVCIYEWTNTHKKNSCPYCRKKLIFPEFFIEIKNKIQNQKNIVRNIDREISGMEDYKKYLANTIVEQQQQIFSYEKICQSFSYLIDKKKIHKWEKYPDKAISFWKKFKEKKLNRIQLISKINYDYVINEMIIKNIVKRNGCGKKIGREKWKNSLENNNSILKDINKLFVNDPADDFIDTPTIIDHFDQYFDTLYNDLTTEYNVRLQTPFPDVEHVPLYNSIPIFTHNPGYTMQVYDELEEWGL